MLIDPHFETDASHGMLESMRRRIDALELDLSGLTVLTEAATGAYACTAVIAALAGARVQAIARDTAAHGSAREAASATLELAAQAKVAHRIELLERLDAATLAECDIVTNSGHLRPITAAMIAALPPHAVIGLMFEAWEFRRADLDLAACRRHGIRVAAVNERHPDVAVFPFLGPLCLRLLADAGLDPVGRRIALLCDNPFADYIGAGLAAAGAEVDMQVRAGDVGGGPWDAVVVALDPSRNLPLGAGACAHLASVAEGTLVAQFWGDVDRDAAARSCLTVVPDKAPHPGHMGILLSALGHEPIVRLQSGGLRAAEVVFCGADLPPGGIAELV